MKFTYYLAVQFVAAVPMRNLGSRMKATAAKAAPTQLPFNEDSSWVGSELSDETYNNVPNYPGSSIEPGSESDESSEFLLARAAQRAFFQAVGFEEHDDLKLAYATFAYEFVLGGGNPSELISEEEWLQSKPSASSMIMGSGHASENADSKAPRNKLRINTNPTSPSGNSRLKPTPNAPTNRLHAWKSFWKSEKSPRPPVSLLKGSTENWYPGDITEIETEGADDETVSTLGPGL